MSAEAFNLLSENIDEVDFLDPILVVPKQDGSGRFRIIDGEHRFEALRLRDATEAACVVADPDRIPETRQKFQTVRFNAIRGKLNQKKFNALVKDLMESGSYSYEELAREMGFADEDEFMSLIEASRESLPSEEAKKALDREVARGNIATVDQLADILQRIFTQYGSTLPFHYLIIDFAGKQSLWVRIREKGAYQKVLKAARECQAAGVTFDSVITTLLSLLNVQAFVKRYGERLEGPDEEQEGENDLLEPEEEE